MLSPGVPTCRGLLLASPQALFGPALLTPQSSSSLCLWEATGQLPQMRRKGGHHLLLGNCAPSPPPEKCFQGNLGGCGHCGGEAVPGKKGGTGMGSGPVELNVTPQPGPKPQNIHPAAKKEETETLAHPFPPEHQGISLPALWLLLSPCPACWVPLNLLLPSSPHTPSCLSQPSLYCS